MRRSLLALHLPVLLVIGLVAAPACGGGNSPTAPTGPQPFNQTIAGNVAVFGTTVHSFSAPRSGTMTLRLSWSSAVDLDLFISPPTCNSLYPKAQCGLLAAANGVVNPEVITRSVASGEQFKFWVDNLSATQSANYTLAIDIQ